MLWGEYSEDLSSVRFCSPLGGLKVSIQGHKLVAESEGEKCWLMFPLEYDLDSLVVPPVVRVDDSTFEYMAVRLPVTVTSDFLHSVMPNSSLYEDWAAISALTCRSCGTELTDLIDLSALTACLLPSATWGFEDMRVCEECGPLVAHHGHAQSKKSKSDNFFVSDSDVYFAKSNVSHERCIACDAEIVSSLSPGEQQAIQQRIPKSSSDVELVKVEKRELGGPMSGYTDTASLLTEKCVRFTADDGKKLVTVKSLTGERDAVVITSKGVWWASKVQFRSSAVLDDVSGVTEVTDTVLDAIEQELVQLGLPLSMSLSKQWRSSLVRQTPIVREL